MKKISEAETSLRPRLEPGTHPLQPLTAPSGAKILVATLYDDVQFILADKNFTRELYRHPEAPALAGSTDLGNDPDVISNMDPPRHTRLRRTLSGAFSTRQIDSWRPRIADLTADLAESMLAAGSPCDLIAAYAQPIPLLVLCELLGVPAEDRTIFQAWVQTLFTAGPDQVRATALKEFNEYVADLIARHRRRPADQLIDLLVSATQGHGAGLGPQELPTLIRTLIIAGYHTVASVLGAGLYTLLCSPGWFQNLAQAPARAPLIRATVEELLRYVPTVELTFPRLATGAVCLPSGTHIQPGAVLVPSPAAANRDPRRFPHPHTLDIERPGTAHLAFGHGPHFCLGAHLARTELETALHTLLTRAPTLHLAGPDAAQWHTAGLIRSLQSLTVRW